MHSASSAVPVVAFDFAKDDRYLQHLTDLGESQSICAAEDIFNERGVLLVKKGAKLSRDVSTRLQGHRLSKALDEVSALERAIKPSDLVAAYDDLFQRFDDFSRVHQANRFEASLRQLCLGKMLPYILLQRLTILQHQQKSEFDHALFCGWFAALLAEELHCTAQQVYDAFIAGLFHDVGRLHVDEHNATTKPADHIWIGRQLLQRTGIFDHDVLTAIAEHHERCDGTGWPLARSENELGLLGQIIAVCDATFSVRQDEYQNGHLGNCLPFLKINAHAHFYKTFQAAFAVLSRAGFSASFPSLPDHDGAMRDEIVSRTGGMQRVLTELVSLSDCLSNQLDPARKHNLENLTGKLLHIVRASGLVSDGLITMLSSMRPEEGSPSRDELAEVDEMQLELLWLMQRALRNMRDLFEAEAVKFPHRGSEMQQQIYSMQDALDGIWRAYHQRTQRSEHVALRNF